MLGMERYNEIMMLLNRDRSVSVKSLSKKLFMSEATIRRDLNQMEKQGLIKRTYGGAVLIEGLNKEVPLYVRESQQSNAKREICKNASRLIKDGDIIMLDASSTVQYIVEYLKQFKDLTVITNGSKTADALGKLHIKTYCTGGMLLENSSAFIGWHAENMIKEINADLFFFSCRGLSMDGKLTDASVEETKLRQIMFEHSKRKIFLCDSSKFGHTYFYNFCDLNQVDQMFCEIPLPNELEVYMANSRTNQ